MMVLLLRYKPFHLKPWYQTVLTWRQSSPAGYTLCNASNILLFQGCRICTENLCCIQQSFKVFQPVAPRRTHSYESLPNQALWCLPVIVKHWTSCSQWSLSILGSKKQAGCVRKGIEGARSGYHAPPWNTVLINFHEPENKTHFPIRPVKLSNGE